MSEQSETPRTDDLHAQWGGGDANLRSRYFKMKILARSLERELFELTRELQGCRDFLAHREEELIGKIEELKASLSLAHNQLTDIAQSHVAAERELEELRGKLEPYLHHRPSCAKRDGGECNCGLVAALTPPEK